MRAQLGNSVGVAARDIVDETLLATVVADGSNNFTVAAADLRKLSVGMVVDIVVKATGATSAGALGRTITGLNNATNTVTYSGADLTLDTTYGIYLTGQWELPSPAVSLSNGPNDPYANLNGGPSVYSGFTSGLFHSVQLMRDRLTAISATTYSAAELDKMTMNDLVYAIRVNDYLGSI